MSSLNMISIPLSRGQGLEGKHWGGAGGERMGEGLDCPGWEGREGKESSLTRMPLPAAFKKKYLPACWLPRNACCAWNGCDIMHKTGRWRSGLIFVSKQLVFLSSFYFKPKYCWSCDNDLAKQLAKWVCKWSKKMSGICFIQILPLSIRNAQRKRNQNCNDKTTISKITVLIVNRF